MRCIDINNNLNVRKLRGRFDTDLLNAKSFHREAQLNVQWKRQRKDEKTEEKKKERFNFYQRLKENERQT